MFPKDNRLLLVDGHACAYRAYHAIRNLTAPDGAPTNAIFGFIKTLAKIRQQTRPSWLQVVWDGGLAAERLAALPQYKAQRPSMPDPLKRQISGIMEYLQAAGISSFCQPGVEADDWIATATRQATAQGANVIIASADKDFLQLVGPSVALLNPSDSSAKLWGMEQVIEKTGVKPEQVVDWLSLIGDTVDNIPGVRGVGPKTAAKLLRQYGTIHALYEHLNDLNNDAVSLALREAADDVRRNQRLVRLNDQLPMSFDVAQTRLREPDTGRLRELYAQWGFHSLLRELEPPAAGQGELFLMPGGK